MKNRTEIPVGKLKLSEILEKLWAHLKVESITKFVMSIRTLTIFFSFLLFYFIFSDLLFFFFIGKTMKKARDKEVT